MRDIRNIIFDLGGVIIDINPENVINGFESIGCNETRKLLSNTEVVTLFEDFEIGKINKFQWLDHIRRTTKINSSDEDIIQCWNSMLGNIPLRRLQILQQLQLHYNTYLYSNTNEIHETAFNEILRKQCGFSSFGVFFDKIYYSHHIHIRKPELEGLEFILSDNKLNPSETLFIDDTIENIQAAKSIGIQTLWLSPGMTIENDVFRPKNI